MKLLFILIITLSITGILLIELIPIGSDELKESNWILQNKYSSYFIFNKAKINYIKMGKGEPLLLIHGGGSWSYSYRNNIIPLSKHFTVYAIDIPGHGYSEIPKNYNYSLENINEVLLAFFNANKINKAHIIGNSWGGGWVIYFAVKNPHRVKKTVLIDSSGLSDTNEYNKSLWKYLSLPIIGKAILHFVKESSVNKSYRNEIYYDGTLVTKKDVKEIFTPLYYKKNLVAQMKYQKNLDWSKTDSRLHELQNVFLIWGKNDKYLPVEMVKEFNKKIDLLKFLTLSAFLGKGLSLKD